MNERSGSFPGSCSWCGGREKTRWQWTHTPLHPPSSALLFPVETSQTSPWTWFCLLPYWKTINSSQACCFTHRFWRLRFKSFHGLAQAYYRKRSHSLWLTFYLAFCLSNYFIPFTVVPLLLSGSGMGSPKPFCISGIWGEVCSGLLGKKNYSFLSPFEHEQPNPGCSWQPSCNHEDGYHQGSVNTEQSRTKRRTEKQTWSPDQTVLGVPVPLWTSRYEIYFLTTWACLRHTFITCSSKNLNW